MGIYDVPATYLIEEVAEKLKTEIEAPPFSGVIKTGVHRERAPQRQDWFYMRMASILYRTYKVNIIGTEMLRSYYGGKRNRGVKTEHRVKASGKVIRTAVQSLEKAGYLEKAKPKGRKITGKGQKLLNEFSKVVAKNLAEGKYKKKQRIRVVDVKAKEVKDAIRKQGQDDKKKIDSKDKDKKDKQQKKGESK